MLLLAGAATGQDSTSNFWSAVTPQPRPFDTARLELCYRLVLNLPENTIDRTGRIDCPDESAFAAAEHSTEEFKSLFRQALRLQRLGYKECCLYMLEALTRHYPSSDLRLTAFTELIYTHLANMENIAADSVGAVALRIAGAEKGQHSGLLWVTALSAHKNRRTEAARQQLARALTLARKEGNRHWELRILTALGYINRDVFFGYTLKAVPDHTKALELAESERDTFFIITNLVALGLNYGDAQQLDLHFDYLNRALQYLKVYEQIFLRMSIQNVLCEKLPVRYPPAQVFALRKEVLREAKMCRSAFFCDVSIRLANQYLNNNQLEEAKKVLDDVREAFQRSGMSVPDQLMLEQSYYDYAKRTGQTTMALRHLENAYSAVSEFYIRRNADLLSRLETEYRTGEKEQLLQTTRRQKSWLLALSAFIAVLGAFIFAGYLKQKKVATILGRQNSIIQHQSEALKSLEKLKSRFFANVSHELRTPLTLMLGPLSHLYRQHHWPAREQVMLEAALRNTRHLLNLVNEILDLSKLETGRLEVNEQAVNWREALQPTVAQFSSFSDSDVVRFIFDYRADPGLNVCLDTAKVDKIVQNFLSNAVKFTPKGGTVTLIAEALENHLLVTVRDCGPGIHPDDLPYIFDRFYQSKQPDIPARAGTGIGLSLCKELAELLQGKVWVESEFGEGSAFFFRFPKKTAPAGTVMRQPVPVGDNTMATPDPETPVVSASGYRARVLIVEDNADLRAYMGLILGDYELIFAENGRGAVQYLREALSEDSACQRPDMILSDLMMPFMDGFQLLEWVKSRDEYRHVPFLMLTARTDVNIKLQALRIGVDDYILKPFLEEELIARVHNQLEHYFERVQLRQFVETEKTEAPVPVLSEANAKWLEGLEKLMRKKLTDPAFNFNWLASELHLSERQFHRKTQQLTGLTPNKYLQEMRMQTARDLLLAERYTTVKEVGFAVGYRDTPYFSSLFLARFGAVPSTYLR